MSRPTVDQLRGRAVLAVALAHWLADISALGSGEALDGDAPVGYVTGASTIEHDLATIASAREFRAAVPLVAEGDLPELRAEVVAAYQRLARLMPSAEAASPGRVRDAVGEALREALP